ncbi:Protein of unknown function [Geosporobacter subterraneus DSM 17957]|uniref:DUF3189 family protein n=1 Tax=Geosporobacter subterraneus DSM 17957 TaxID=1121919 RepID=A0A1M6MGG1_9FIRM|nr:DUF3189 family protein [Geosporobacter subterraneus]SHJ82476.1 Protein of unknown function [Geosporobacter subterraneus DSM 17957]
MYIIYHDVGGTYGPIIAAAIHLKRLPLDQIPEKSDLEKLISTNGFQPGPDGRLIFHGKDSNGHQVYSLGRKHAPAMFHNAFKSIITISKTDLKELIYTDTMEAANLMMVLGGRYARKAGLSSLGKPLLTAGILRAYPEISSIVWKTLLKTEP